MKRGIMPVSRDRQADAVDRCVGVAPLMLYQSEQVEGLRMARLEGQDVAAQSLGIGGASGALLGERGVEPPDDWGGPAHLTNLCPEPGAPPLLSVHLNLIAQQTDTYPPCHSHAENNNGESFPLAITKLASVGGRVVTYRSGLRRTGPSRDANSAGSSADLVLPQLAALREPQPRQYRGEWRLFWVCRKRRCILSRRAARAVSHRAAELGPRLQPGHECRPRPRPAGLRQDPRFDELGKQRKRVQEFSARLVLHQ